ncbi:putative DNA repair protein RadA-like protein [Coprococcus comes ATCC 27758]|uniref:Putative DNA repair protein RadA-like protein n=1 Tax=Coprococcus comes ATCC 27758 TaxID=470146 RepID=C0B7I7_9FIRM|nr:putative DNA repair protein RadA-like protein [Coprococcus comes ATCC 27758]
MAKAKKSVFFCQNCGHEESKWLGQCPMCKEWNSFVEECVTTSNTAAVKAAKEIRIVPLSEVKTENEERVTTEIKELDRVLGGGIVPGSLILVGGDPGIGKSTLLLQVCQKLAKKKNERFCTYQGKNRFARLNCVHRGWENLMNICFCFVRLIWN